MTSLSRAHKDEIVEEVFDLLHSCLDFLTFKQTILSYKAVRRCLSDSLKIDIIVCLVCRLKRGSPWILVA